jgi:hypothetical protein
MLSCFTRQITTRGSGKWFCNRGHPTSRYITSFVHKTRQYKGPDNTNRLIVHADIGTLEPRWWSKQHFENHWMLIVRWSEGKGLSPGEDHCGGTRPTRKRRSPQDQQATTPLSASVWYSEHVRSQPYFPAAKTSQFPFSSEKDAVFVDGRLIRRHGLCFGGGGNQGKMETSPSSPRWLGAGKRKTWGCISHGEVLCELLPLYEYIRSDDDLCTNRVINREQMAGRLGMHINLVNNIITSDAVEASATSVDSNRKLLSQL